MLKAAGKLGDHRHTGLGDAQKQRHRNGQPQHKVHKRPGAQDDNLLPCRLPGKGPGVARVLVLSLHSAVAPHGKGPQRVQSLPPLLGPQGGAHADGELVHLHPQQLGRDKVSELVDGNEYAKERNRQQNI